MKVSDCCRNCKKWIDIELEDGLKRCSLDGLFCPPDYYCDDFKLTATIEEKSAVDNEPREE